jgi:hypothetical protein
VLTFAKTRTSRTKILCQCTVDFWYNDGALAMPQCTAPTSNNQKYAMKNWLLRMVHWCRCSV